LGPDGSQATPEKRLQSYDPDGETARAGRQGGWAERVRAVIARSNADQKSFEAFARKFFLSAIALCATALLIAFAFRGKDQAASPSGSRVEAMLEADQPGLIRPVSAVIFTNQGGELATVRTTLPWIEFGKPRSAKTPSDAPNAHAKRVDEASTFTAIGLCKAVETDLSALRIRSSIDILAAHNIVASWTTTARKCRAG
jgi:hypothetical protein